MGKPPVFNARFIAAMSFDKLYRVYAVGEQLVFIRIGGQGGFRDGLTHPLGIVGLLLRSAIGKRAEKKKKAQLEAVDQTGPEQLLPRHADNFRLGAAEVRDAAVDPPTFFATHGPHVGRWQLNLADGRRLNFQFETTEDMRVALDLLPGLFLSGFRVNVVWNESREKYERRDDAA